MAVVLLLFAAVAPYGWWSLPVVFLVTVLGSVLVVNLQLRLMDVAGDAQTLGRRAQPRLAQHRQRARRRGWAAWSSPPGWGYRVTGPGRRRAVAAGLVVLALSLRVHRRQRVA